jgi:hypothetical protein
LDSIVYAFLAGQSAESIAQSFPALTLEEVSCAIAFYLVNRKAIDEYLIDEYLTEGERKFEILKQHTREANVWLYQKLDVSNTATSLTPPRGVTHGQTNWIY